MGSLDKEERFRFAECENTANIYFELFLASEIETRFLDPLCQNISNRNFDILALTLSLLVHFLSRTLSRGPFYSTFFWIIQ